MSYKTTTGNRTAEFAKLEINPPEGYIGGQIFPSVNVREKTGVVYFRTLTADTAAQTGRELGVAPTSVMLADSHTTYGVSELISRYTVDKSEVLQMGGLAEADNLGGVASIRSVMEGVEKAHAAALFDSVSYAAAASVSGGIVDAIIDAAKGIKRYAGKLAFVCSTSVYQHLIKQDEIKALLVRSFGGLSAEQVMSLSPAVFRAMLQGIFAFDQVLIGDDNFWEIEHMEDAAAVVKLPPVDEFSHKMNPVLGKTMVYMNDSGTPYEVEAFYDDNRKMNVYDASSWINIKTLNAGAKKLLKGLGTATT